MNTAKGETPVSIPAFEVVVERLDLRLGEIRTCQDPYVGNQSAAGFGTWYVMVGSHAYDESDGQRTEQLQLCSHNHVPFSRWSTNKKRTRSSQLTANSVNPVDANCCLGSETSLQPFGKRGLVVRTVEIRWVILARRAEVEISPV